MVDQGTSSTSMEMKNWLGPHGFRLNKAPVETPGAIGIVGRYHAILRVTYQIIRQELDNQTGDHDCSQHTVFAVNCAVGPE